MYLENRSSAYQANKEQNFLKDYKYLKRKNNNFEQINEKLLIPGAFLLDDEIINFYRKKSETQRFPPIDSEAEDIIEIS